MARATDMLKNKIVFVTGGSGFIGAHLCRALVACDAEVHALSRSARRAEALMHRYRWWRGDVEDRERMLELVRCIKPDVVFHLASLVTGVRERDFVLPMLRVNLMGTVHLLDAATEANCKRVVLSGSLVEADDGREGPSSPYAAAKEASSMYARMYHALYDTPVVVLRLGMVYGPAQEDRQKLVPYVTTSLLEGKTPALSSGHHRLDWIYIADVVEALLRGATAPDLEGEVIDVGTGTQHSVRDVVDQIAEVVGAEVEPAYGARPERDLERTFIADIDRTFTLLEWKAQTSLSDGLRRTVEWYRNLSASSEEEHQRGIKTSEHE